MSDFPYPGLRPFNREETDIFFGREEQVDQLLEKLGQSRFLAVVGVSGCGKSSLVRTGLIAGLETGFLANAGARWRVAEMRPGNHPMRNLAQALLGESALGQERASDDEAEPFLHATLRRGPLGLVETLHETPLPKRTNLLVIVDQFEEIFRYRKEGDSEEAEAFVALLLASVKQEEIPVYVVLTMRSDFLGDCALFNGLPEAMNESQFLTPRLTREQQQAAIVGPAAVFGGTVEGDLVNRLLNDMGADPDQLPLMQHVLMRMWTRAQSNGATLTLDDYEEVGGLSRALSAHADEAFNELNDKQKDIAEVLFRSLCERGSDQRDTRRPERLDEVAAVAQVKPAQLRKVVEKFRESGRSFIMPPPETDLREDTVLDISHESLIRQWRQLNNWVEAEGKSADTYRRLQRTARFWEEGEAALLGTPDLDIALNWKQQQEPNPLWAARYGSDFELAMKFLDASEQKRRADEAAKKAARQQKLQRARWQLALAVFVVIILLGVVLWALRQQQIAEEAKEIADKALAEVQVANKALEAALATTDSAKQQADSATVVALAAQSRAKASERTRTLGLFESHLTQASLLAHNEDYARARAVLDSSRKLDKEIPAERRHARSLLAWYSDLMGGAPTQTYTGAGAPLQDVALSPDGRLLAAVGEKGTAVLFDIESGKLVKRLQGHSIDEYVDAAVIHPQGKWLATGGDDRRIILWSLPEGEKLREWDAPGRVWALAINPDGTMVASGGTDNDITIWDTAADSALQTLEGHTSSVKGLAFSPDGRLLASAAYDNTARLWDLETGESRHILRGHTNHVQAVAFHPADEILATGSSDKSVRLWDVASGDPLRVLSGHQAIVLDLAFADSGRRLISASFDRTLREWDIESGVTLRVLQGHNAGVTVVAAQGAQSKRICLRRSARRARWLRHCAGWRFCSRGF